MLPLCCCNTATTSALLYYYRTATVLLLHLYCTTVLYFYSPAVLLVTSNLVTPVLLLPPLHSQDAPLPHPLKSLSPTGRIHTALKSLSPSKPRRRELRYSFRALGHGWGVACQTQCNINKQTQGEPTLYRLRLVAEIRPQAAMPSSGMDRSSFAMRVSRRIFTMPGS